MAFKDINQPFITYATAQTLPPSLQAAADQAWQKLIHRHAAFAELNATHQNQIKWRCALSDFICDSLLSHPDFFIQQLTQTDTKAETTDPQIQFEQSVQAFKTALSHIKNVNELHSLLRKHRKTQMAWLAWQDFDGSLLLDQSLNQISQLADLYITYALDWLYQAECELNGVPTNTKGEKQPLFIMAMGKLGGGELNFSSDIDLIFCYPESGQTQGGRRSTSNHEFFTRLGQKLITALHQITADGYVYRVDMRLRPYGDSGPLVMSFSMLEDYYAEQGRDWERYAMLKARLLTLPDWQNNPNSPFQNQLQDLITPFVYRRYIDYSAIESLRKMKKLIAQENRRQSLTNNIKLGEGGIREVEFVVQAFQLIRGGQETQLQIKSTRQALDKLEALGEISQNDINDLRTGYYFLRKTEHVLQQIADQQTQTLPDKPLDQDRLIFAMGFENWDAFKLTLKTQMNGIRSVWQNVIHDEETDTEECDIFDYWLSNLDANIAISHLTQDHPTLDANAFWQKIQSDKDLIRKKNMGRRGQEILNKLMPNLINLCLNTEHPLKLLGQVNELIAAICTRTAYLELLYENQAACRQLLKFLTASPWIGHQLCAQPFLLDELLLPKQISQTLTETHYHAELRERLLRIENDDLEALMDALRHFKLAYQLRIAAADLMGDLPIMKVSDHLTWLAEAIMEQVVNIAWQQVSDKHGVPENLAQTQKKGFAVIGYGKMGGWELGYGSDLDLVFVHNQATQQQTTGEKPVGITQFYTRLAQRIMHIFSTQMHSGILYEVDMRLRPAGASGLLVTTLEGFEAYQKTEAWTWEHQALARARNILGDDDLLRNLSEVRHKILATKRDRTKLKTDICEMRGKMFTHLSKGSNDLFDLKQDIGGITDIEFITQYIVLAYTHAFEQLTVWSDNIRILTLASEFEIISSAESQHLIEAYKAYRAAGHRLTLAEQKLVSNTSDYKTHITNVKAIWQKLLIDD